MQRVNRHGTGVDAGPPGDPRGAAQPAHPYWPAALANMAWLWSGEEPARVRCIGLDTGLLADEFRRTAGPERVSGPDSVDAEVPDEAWDLVAGRVGNEAAGLGAILQQVARGGCLLLLVPVARQAGYVRQIASCGLRVERRYLVARSLERPMHFVPDRARSVDAHLQVASRRMGIRRLGRRLLLQAGWRPSEFGACLILARKDP
jgi:hypothetical protein